MFYKKLSINLPNHIFEQLQVLDWSKLTLAYDFTKTTLRDEFTRYQHANTANSMSWWELIKFYGPILYKTATVLTYKLPGAVEEEILQQWKINFKQLEILPTVTLQVVYGGTIVPLHVDETRNTSLLFPISNHSSAKTNFYKLLDKTLELKTGLVNPYRCQRVDSVIIDQPTLLNVDEIHDVTYNKINKQNPRVTLSLKWPFKFQQVLSIFNNV